MPDAVNKFSRRSNKNLLQLWKGRDRLDDVYIDQLRDEIEKRGLTCEAEQIVKSGVRESIYGNLPKGPWTYLNASVVYWWIRELWLRFKTRTGAPVEAKVERVYRTGSWYPFAARVELNYSYRFQGASYSGRITRDFLFDLAAANSLAFDNHPGDRITVVVSRLEPSISLYPSGLGSIDPLLALLQSLFAWAMVAGIIRLILLSLT